MNMNFLSDSLNVKYDTALCSLVITHSDRRDFPDPLVRIREETYRRMNFEELSKFLGARVLVLMPTMRAHFKDEIERMEQQQ